MRQKPTDQRSSAGSNSSGEMEPINEAVSINFDETDNSHNDNRVVSPECEIATQANRH